MSVNAKQCYSFSKYKIWQHLGAIFQSYEADDIVQVCRLQECHDLQEKQTCGIFWLHFAQRKPSGLSLLSASVVSALSGGSLPDDSVSVSVSRVFASCLWQALCSWFMLLTRG